MPLLNGTEDVSSCMRVTRCQIGISSAGSDLLEDYCICEGGGKGVSEALLRAFPMYDDNDGVTVGSSVFSA